VIIWLSFYTDLPVNSGLIRVLQNKYMPLTVHNAEIYHDT